MAGVLDSVRAFHHFISVPEAALRSAPERIRSEAIFDAGGRQPHQIEPDRKSDSETALCNWTIFKVIVRY